MTRKPASMYRRRERPYTRRKYMGGVPGSKVVHYDMGNLQENFPIELTLVVREPCQIRHTALEAARVCCQSLSSQGGGQDQLPSKAQNLSPSCHPGEQAGYRCRRRPRFQRHEDGLRKGGGNGSQGRGRTKLFTLGVPLTYLNDAKVALTRAGHKLPTPIQIVVESGQELIK